MTEVIETDNKWHLDKRVQISHVFTTAAAILAVTLYLGDIKKDVEILKIQVSSQHIVDETQDRTIVTVGGQLSNQLNRVNDKLDRLIERK
jgi:hypothetical protein